MNWNLLTWFKSVKDAERFTCTHSSSIVDNCRQNLKSAGNFLWMYLEDYHKIVKNRDMMSGSI